MEEFLNESSYIWYDKYLPELKVAVYISLSREAKVLKGRFLDYITSEPDPSSPVPVSFPMAIYKPTGEREEIKLHSKKIYRYKYEYIKTIRG